MLPFRSVPVAYTLDPQIGCPPFLSRVSLLEDTGGRVFLNTPGVMTTESCLEKRCRRITEACRRENPLRESRRATPRGRMRPLLSQQRRDPAVENLSDGTPQYCPFHPSHSPASKVFSSHRALMGQEGAQSSQKASREFQVGR